jgi:hypothetical protein
VTASAAERGNRSASRDVQRAKAALAVCARIDECKDWADKAEAMASYARQSGDIELRKMTDRTTVPRLPPSANYGGNARRLKHWRHSARERWRQQRQLVSAASSSVGAVRQ